MKELLLSGLDGANPLGYLAALGGLRVLVESARVDARLSWRNEGRWRPVMHLSDDAAVPVDLMLRDLEAWRDAPELALEYEKKGKAGKAVRDLKPPPDVFRAFLEEAAEDARPGRRRLADFAAAFGTDVATDGNDNTKPTALHFTAGQQNFLEMVTELAAGVRREHFEEALFGPWRYESDLPVLRWDVSGERLYALLASNPSGEKARGVPGADWLAFQSLPLFPSFPKTTLGGTAQIATTCFTGRGKNFTFRWPLWEPPATLDTVRSLLAQPVSTADAPQRKARGIVLLLQSQVRRSDHGYGTFSAAVPATPSAKAG